MNTTVLYDLQLPPGKKVYFASDNHLGAPNPELSLDRERRFVRWLEQVRADAAAIFLLGDLFDFWFEYGSVVPKGHVRVLGKLAELTDAGIPVYYFVGNHDLWMFGYFERELGIPVFKEPQQWTIAGKRFFLAHGDGLGPGDRGFKWMKKVFTNPVARWLFRWLHPDIGVPLAQHLSVNNKIISGEADTRFLGEDKEWLILYSRRKLETLAVDYFVYGHRHLPMTLDLGGGATYVNLGDMISYWTYAVFDGDELMLREWTD